MDEDTVGRWLGAYIVAWQRNDPDEIASLFTEDAVYSYGPFSADVVGRDAIARSWLEDPDEPGTWEAEYHPVAIDGETAIVNGRSRYFNADRSLKDEYDNIFLIRFDANGRCAEFREWFMKRPPG